MKIYLIGILFLITYSSSGQTCCSGGVPVSNHLGFNLAERGDLQPGSGAKDALFRVNVTKPLNIRPSIVISSNILYSLKGSNNSYLETESYGFGDEIQFVLDVKDQFLLRKQ